MIAGVPGAGIGGLFYLISALLLPLRGLWRRGRGESVSWRQILQSAALALGIFAGIWLTGWLLGFLLGPAPRAVGGLLGRKTALFGRHENILRGAALAIGLATLGLVLLSVQIARFFNRRKKS
jgi:hypothetical protein